MAAGASEVAADPREPDTGGGEELAGPTEPDTGGGEEPASAAPEGGPPDEGVGLGGSAEVGWQAEMGLAGVAGSAGAGGAEGAVALAREAEAVE